MTESERKDDPEVQDDAQDEDERESTDVRYQVSSYGADYPVDGLVKRLREGAIDLPTFQREFVWPLWQASRFIESLLLGLPVPAIFLSRDPETQKLLVIDGQQRLKSLLTFYDGVFRGREFALQGVNKDFAGKTYKSLEDEDRRRLDDAIVHAIIVRQDDPKGDDSSIYLVFERLNTTSTPLSPQEIRACVYHGAFNAYLDAANDNEHWRAIFGAKSLRQKDKELLLRFFALRFDIAAYERPMKVFLSNFMRKNRHLETYSRAALDAAFKPAVEMAATVLGAKAFRPQRALNASVTDALLVGIARRLEGGDVTDKSGFKRAIDGVLSDKEFTDLYSVGTTNSERVQGRIARIEAALASVK